MKRGNYFKLLFIAILVVSTYVFPILTTTVLAQVPCLQGQGPLQPGQQYCNTVPVVNPLGSVSTVPQLVNQAVKTILGVVGALALFMFVYGGILWMTSAGNTNRIERGKDTLIWATIGLFVIFTSYAILNFILSALGGS